MAQRGKYRVWRFPLSSTAVAQKIATVMIDDLTEEEGEDVETVEFGIDGINYEIDLSEANATALRDALVHYSERARRRGRTGTRQRPSRGRARSNGHSNGDGPTRTQLAPAVDPKQARTWARGQGYTVPDRGRLPREVTDAYLQHLASV